MDWSDIKDEHRNDFSKGKALEVILKAGEVLYLPSFWLHYIVSLGTSIQCNARSGTTHENDLAIQECGFGLNRMGREKKGKPLKRKSQERGAH